MTTSSSSTEIPMGGGTSNNPAPSSKAFALHQRSNNASNTTNGYDSSSPAMNNGPTSPSSSPKSRSRHYHHSSTSSNSYNSKMMTPSQYIARLTDISQMDMQSAFDQMKCLLNPSQAQRVYKLSYYRKQTKGHYARDDPAFVTLQITFLVLSSIAYSIAFIEDSFWKTLLIFLFHSVVVNYIVVGIAVASIGQLIANQHLTKDPNETETSSEPVEWMYAFDIHCNSFFPFFVIVYIIQYFLLPIVLSNTFFAFILSNTIYTLAFGSYFYITHLGYRNLTHLKNTELFLIPMVVVVFIFVLNFVGYPFGFGWNASRIMAHLYFET